MPKQTLPGKSIVGGQLSALIPSELQVCVCGEDRGRRVELFSHFQIPILTNYFLLSNKKGRGRVRWDGR